MLTLMEKKRKFTQYAAGGAVAVVILFAWISIPLMHNSSLDSSANPNGFFRTKTADVHSLASEIPLEGAAPGYSLNGGMFNNPVTSGENIAATLFQSGPPEDGVPADSPAESFASAVQFPEPPAPAPGASPGAAPAAKAKISPVPSIGSGNSNTMTVGSTHNNLFGSGAAAKKKDAGLAAAADSVKTTRKPGFARNKRSALVAGLQKMNARSLSAAKSFSADRSRSGASSAFNGGVKRRPADLSTSMELAAEGAGITMSAAAQDLKRNDPSMSSKKITIPEPKVDKDAEADEEMKRMILQMLLSSMLGGLFSDN